MGFGAYDRQAMSQAKLRVDRGRSRLSGERKPVTVLFADVVGSTSLAERLDPEDWSEIMNGAFARMSEAVNRYEGTVAQLAGDGLLAIFGAPIAHEDDPARAARAGLAIIAGIDDYASGLDPSVRDVFKIRVGINTGPVVVGRIGGESEEYTALGDPVNVAARLQNAAAPGSVLVTAATRRLIGSGADFRTLGAIEVRGKSEPIEAFEVLRIDEHGGRQRGVPGLTSPMVGRAAELERLTELLDVVRAGRGRMAVVLGEPGIGKSRLLAELRGRAAQRSTSWHEGRCLSYGQALPFYLVSELVRSLLALPAEGGSADDVLSAARELLDDEVERAGPLLAHLLSLRLSDAAEADIARLDPEALAGRYLLAVRSLVIAAAHQPLVIVCEDIHWADPASVELLTKLLTIVGRIPLLLVCVSRPDRDAAGWQLIGSARDQLGEVLTELKLSALSQDDSRQLVANLLAIESLTGSARDEILRRADGNPFFVEEIVRMLIDRGAIRREEDRWMATPQVDQIEIPESIHGLLLARIDRLPHEPRQALRIASVIGRRFGTTVLQEILDQ
jgi:class 3 adenylate cyclase